MTYVSLAISILAFALSATVAWLTLFRRGQVKMTKPTFVAFCYDVGRDGQSIPKIFIRALIYSTGKRGHVIENMYLIVRNAQGQTTLNIWGYGDDKLSRGSGIFVGETGLAANHHFNPPLDLAFFDYVPGDYHIRVFATLPEQKRPIHIQTVHLKITDDRLLKAAEKMDTAIWFEWQPDINDYYGHLEMRRKLT